MTDLLGIDRAWTQVNPAAAKAAGYNFVLGYVSEDPTKNMTSAYRVSCHQNGLGAGIVWETTSTRATQGSAAGSYDGHAAAQQAEAMGWPAGLCIFWAVDEDVAASSVLAYAEAFHAAVGPYSSGPYGSARLIDGVHAANVGARYFWQCEAWSGMTVSANANIYQRISHTRPTIQGTAANAYDEDVQLTPDAGLWLPASAPAPKPAPSPSPSPSPTPAPSHNPMEDSMALFVTAQNGDGKVWVCPLDLTSKVHIDNPADLAALNATGCYKSVVLDIGQVDSIPTVA